MSGTDGIVDEAALWAAHQDRDPGRLAVGMVMQLTDEPSRWLSAFTRPSLNDEDREVLEQMLLDHAADERPGGGAPCTNVLQLDNIRRAARGEAGALKMAFTWMRTPQGETYWRRLHDHSLGEATPERVRPVLSRWHRHHEEIYLNSVWGSLRSLDQQTLLGEDWEAVAVWAEEVGRPAEEVMECAREGGPSSRLVNRLLMAARLWYPEHSARSLGLDGPDSPEILDGLEEGDECRFEEALAMWEQGLPDNKTWENYPAADRLSDALADTNAGSKVERALIRRLRSIHLRTYVGWGSTAADYDAMSLRMAIEHVSKGSPSAASSIRSCAILNRSGPRLPEMLWALTNNRDGLLERLEAMAKTAESRNEHYARAS